MAISSLFNSDNQVQNIVEQKNIEQKRKIVKQLFMYGSMTNTDIAEHIKLSSPKIISLLNELKEQGIIEEIGQGSSSGGRRPNLYGNCAELFYIIGISINLHKTTVSIFNAKNHKITENKVIYINISQGNSIIDTIVGFTWSLIDELQINRDKVIGIGIEMPGLVDSVTGINKTYLISEIPVAEVFSSKFGKEVIIENDAKTRAFAELKFGLAFGRKNVLALHLDWGIGLGIIVNGKLYKGRDGFAGEFGHIPMVDNGILCKCGKWGCLETIASGGAISRMAIEGIKNKRTSLIFESENNSPDKIEIKNVVQAATLGDQYSISILANTGTWIGKGFAFLIQIFNPELIIIGGRIAEANQYILPAIQQSINAFCNPDLGNEIEIKCSELGAQAGIKGVASLLLERITDKPIKVL